MNTGQGGYHRRRLQAELLMPLASIGWILGLRQVCTVKLLQTSLVRVRMTALVITFMEANNRFRNFHALHSGQRCY